MGTGLFRSKNLLQQSLLFNVVSRTDYVLFTGKCVCLIRREEKSKHQKALDASMGFLDLYFASQLCVFLCYNCQVLPRLVRRNRNKRNVFIDEKYATDGIRYFSKKGFSTVYSLYGHRFRWFDYSGIVVETHTMAGNYRLVIVSYFSFHNLSDRRVFLFCIEFQYLFLSGRASSKLLFAQKAKNLF